MPAETRTIGHIERILHLRKIPMIGTLPAPELGLMAEYARERFFPKGTVIFREGEPPSAVEYLVDGMVHVTRRGRLMGHAGAGAAVGGIGVLARDRDGIQAVAEADTLALELSADAVCRQLVELMRRVPAAMRLPPLVPFDPGRPGGRDLDLVDRILVLRQSPPFARASVNALAELSRTMSEVHFEPGATIWSDGDPAGWILMILEGTLDCATAAGHTFPLGPGSPAGALESTAEMPRWYTAVARTPVIALHDHVDELLDVLEDNFEMSLDYLAVLAKWLMDALEAASAPEEAELQRLYGCEDEGARGGPGILSR
jgi:CRP-like cAMP-binding protein